MLLNKLIQCISVCGFFLMSTMVYAGTKVSVDPDKSSAFIEFSGQQAKDLWAYLEKIQTAGNGFVYADSGMGSTFLTSPSIACGENINHPDVPDKDPSLYECHIALNGQGLAVAN